MKTKILTFVLAACPLALAAWLVNKSDSYDPGPLFALAPAQGVDQGPVAADGVPGKYRETLRKGLEYLVKNQSKAGHWEGDDSQHPVAMTGLVGLALLMERNAPPRHAFPTQEVSDAKYSTNIRTAVDWLMDNSRAGRDGLIFSEHPSETARYMEGHGLATLFLAGAYRDERDEKRRKKLEQVLIRAVRYIVKAQSTQGGWYHTSKVEGHDFDVISATAIQIQALQAAENAGILVPSDTINEGQDYLTKAIGKGDAGAKAGPIGNRAAETAAALACHVNRHLYGDTKHELSKNWFKYCQAEIPVGRDLKFGRDELTHYYYAQALFNQGADTWKSYRTAMFDHLQKSQNQDGSWPAGNGIGVGPIYSTAAWCTILQLDKKSHPSTRPEPLVTL